jgi:hypothetical protein
MSHSHAFQIDKLKNDFDNILTLKREISKIKKVVVDKLSQLKLVYNDLVKTNSKKIFLFCLDSFYFQYKTFTMEMEHIDRFRTLMNNRMYCDYYKLFHIILSYIKENRAELDITELEIKTYPVYKDLEPFSEYKIEDIKEIHSNILMILNKLYGITVEKTDNIEHYNEKHHVGFSISNFLNTLSYENRLLQEQIHLYVNYISFFHISQKRQLNRLHLRMQEFYREVDNNINVNKTFSIEDVGDEDRLHRFFILGEDVSIEDILEDSELLLENSEKILNRIETLSPEPEINADEENDKEEADESEPAITAILDTNEES